MAEQSIGENPTGVVVARLDDPYIMMGQLFETRHLIDGQTGVLGEVNRGVLEQVWDDLGFAVPFAVAWEAVQHRFQEEQG